MSKKVVAWIIGGVVVAFGVVVALVAVRLVVFAPFRTPSASMYPTFAPGSHIWARKLDKTPAYGAVLVFRYPENPEQEFQKRVVGLPGDKIETHGTALSINGWEAPRCTVGKHSYEDPDSPVAKHTGTLEVEWLGDETYLVFHDDHVLALDFGPYTVKGDEYFVMGDNRENSHDSRVWFGGMGGGVPNENTVGRVRAGKIALPRGAESLQSALDACVAKRPSKTRP